MIRIANDLPSDLLKLARRIDFSRIPKEQHSTKINQLKELAEKYNIPKRTGLVVPMDIDLPDCPQALATMISQMDFSGFNIVIRKLAFGVMENWLRKERLLR